MRPRRRRRRAGAAGRAGVWRELGGGGDAWLAPVHSWASELQHGDGDWLEPLLIGLGVDPAPLRPRTKADALAFAPDEADAFERGAGDDPRQALAQRLRAAAAGRPARPLLHRPPPQATLVAVRGGGRRGRVARDARAVTPRRGLCSLSSAMLHLRPNDKWLFVGDSITDAGRREDPDGHLGHGYVRLIRDYLLAKAPADCPKFVNMRRRRRRVQAPGRAVAGRRDRPDGRPS